MCPRGDKRNEVYIGIGSNMGHRIAYLHTAVQSIGQQLGPVTCSAVYETNPVGYTDQPKFLNMVVRVDTGHSPREVFRVLQGIEQEAHRKRDIRFGPRTLDLDVLLYNYSYFCFSDLQIPHARMWSRAFVLVPLADLAPDRRGLSGKSVSTMAEELRQKDEVRYVGRFW
ncbi:2-amino-4-hydroxy-6-hydroxymethyldihydropteridine diphosphokinase [Alicyclobacillus dauci]|uniref:2-amino-4-hydroxy-6-hydroxymethyldihydropteridine diphosphokinase n=1 Tax=Alicyclobacillus dauci TaxID=1475485 RepID=A0ABY6Z5Q9_9BACL|nr:2-amino-4-hydroxy-6-hydroxymethyldihydropteridine diphosphokinase [Alicyclobacillus dauci]WAH37355.1 2-amino-4-hydroxy-6-hydroxymethyldihydropteridine diphosphokinase [Alicyclobacillus dauci]